MQKLCRGHGVKSCTSPHCAAEIKQLLVQLLMHPRASAICWPNVSQSSFSSCACWEDNCCLGLRTIYHHRFGPPALLSVETRFLFLCNQKMIDATRLPEPGYFFDAWILPQRSQDKVSAMSPVTMHISAISLPFSCSLQFIIHTLKWSMINLCTL